ncbi:glycosyltransferase family 4 protein [Spirosoma rigui]|uniref:glycosyltransferase family 4 protein n=1 Tax=Spirosoma rigui TaxID=564064 RepID=UPI0009AF6EA6|nr:glycosyltransferase family 1 protein [Spirosoma rigui]
MRIGIEAQRLLRPHKHGMDIVALELIRALQAIDHDNEYFIFVRPDSDTACLTLQANFTLVQLPGMNYVQWEQVALPRALRAYRIDVLHCTANTGPLLTGVPVILTLHDLLFMQTPAGVNTATLYQRLGNRYRALLVRRLVRRCQSILTISQFAAQQISRELNLPAERIRVLYNGVSTRFCEAIPAGQLTRVQQTYQLPPRYFFFLGSTDPRKNSVNVLNAFIRYGATDPDIQLIVSGKQPSYLKRLLSADEFAFVETRCRFIGYVPDDDLPALYTLAETFLFPSLSEGFGLPILEAMACGTPVITGTLTSMPEVAGNAAVLVDATQPQRIANAMQRLSQDTVLRQMLIRNGKERVTQFSWMRTAEQLLAIYKTFAPDTVQPVPSNFQPI